MTQSAVRHWCAQVQYPDKQPVWFGTVFMRPDAPLAETELELRRAIDGCLPVGYAIVDMKPGAVWFQPEEAA